MDSATNLRIPVIETERLILRGALDADIEVWAAFIADPDVGRYLPGSRTPRTFHERGERLVAIIRACWEQNPPSDVAWIITRKQGGQMMGWSGCGPQEGSADAELVYTLAKPFWGQGYATEAARGHALRPGAYHVGARHRLHLPREHRIAPRAGTPGLQL